MENGQKKLTLLNCNKPKKKEPLSVPDKLPENSLYVPTQSCGRNVIYQLRNAFCHGSLKFDDNSKQYQIEFYNKKHIAGSFSLEAIQEFVNIYLEPKELKKNNK